MRIGLIAPPWRPVPVQACDGTEKVIGCLARGLQELGHEVRLFTVGESSCPVPREYLYRSPPEPAGDSIAEAAHVLAAYEAFAGMDIIHDHTNLGPLLAGRRGMPHPPVVTTSHGPFTRQTRRIYADAGRHAAIVSVSHAQARTAGQVPITAVIHPGIDLRASGLGSGDGGYLLFTGRMSADQGVHYAVRAARKAGARLVIAAKTREPAERRYFEQEVRPLLRPGDELSSPEPLERRLRLMRDAAALVNPISWPEPFGLVMVEALAVGTPVLAFRNGSAPEIVDHGSTGYLCHDEEELAAAICDVPELRRADCRRAAERSFSIERMARDHDRLYRRILLSWPTTRQPEHANGSKISA